MPAKKKKQKKITQEPTTAAILYDILMSEIEPELMSENIPGLEEFHADETPEQARARASHYTWAFHTFATLWDAFVHDCDEQLAAAKSTVLERAQKQETQKSTEILQNIEERMNKA